MKRKSIRDSIIHTAADIFSKFGFKKATMDDIAKSLGMGKSSLYYYFKSKEEVFEAVVIKEAEILRDEIDKKVVKSNLGPKEKLRKYVLTRMRFLKELVNFYAALKEDYLGNLAFTERVREKYDLEEQQYIRRILKEGKSKKIFSIRDTGVAAIAIVTVLKGLEVALLLKNEIEMNQLESHLDDMLHILYHGIVKT